MSVEPTVVEDTAPEPIELRFAKAVRTVRAVPKDKTATIEKKGGGTAYSYTYTDLTDVLRVVKDALDVHDLVLTQPVRTEDGLLFVDCVIRCLITGDELTFPGLGVPTKSDPQANGSTITYGRRYVLTSLFALEVEDDDGKAGHVAATQQGRRTEAEVEIRKIIATLDDDEKAKFKEDFLQRFGSGLVDLPTNRHGDALTWAKEWATVPDEDEPTQHDAEPEEGY